MTTPIPMPPFKWPGSKARLLPVLAHHLPRMEDKNYLEPFLGSGAVYFYMVRERGLDPSRAMLCDINKEVVETYEAIRDFPEVLISLLEEAQALHLERTEEARKDAYLEMRDTYFFRPVDRAARFLFLRATCFNGLYRMNRKGEFNVAFGRYDHPRILNEPGIREASRLLQGATLSVQGYRESLRGAHYGSFIYCDPPYAPVTSSTFRYSEGGFGDAEQIDLAERLGRLPPRISWVVSHSDSEFIRSLYAPHAAGRKVSVGEMVASAGLRVSLSLSSAQFPHLSQAGGTVALAVAEYSGQDVAGDPDANRVAQRYLMESGKGWAKWGGPGYRTTHGGCAVSPDGKQIAWTWADETDRADITAKMEVV